MIYFRELVTFLSLLAWIEMATTVMNSNDCFRNGNDCSKWQRPFTKGKIASPNKRVAAGCLKITALHNPEMVTERMTKP